MVNTKTFKRFKRMFAKDLPYSYRKGEKRFRSGHMRRDGKAECVRQLVEDNPGIFTRSYVKFVCAYVNGNYSLNH